MRSAIVIATYEKHASFLDDLLRSFGTFRAHPIIVVLTATSTARDSRTLDVVNRHRDHLDITLDCFSRDTSEFGALFRAFTNSEAREMFLLYDSCEILDTTMFEIVFERFAGSSVAMTMVYGQFWLSCLGKYRRDVLAKMDLERWLPDNRLEALETEIDFTREYTECDGNVVEFPDPLRLQPGTVERHGRSNRRESNAYLTKWKGHWSIDQVLDQCLPADATRDRSQAYASLAESILSRYPFRTDRE